MPNFVQNDSYIWNHLFKIALGEMDLCFVFSDLQPIVVTSVQSLFYGSSRKKFRLSENKDILVLVIVEVLMYREQKKYKYSDTANDSNGNNG